MSAFTAGPWFYEKSVDDSHRIYGGVFPGAKRAVYDIADLWLPDVEGDAESVRVANARLIAAAPELYEALKAAVEIIDKWIEPETMGVVRSGDGVLGHYLRDEYLLNFRNALLKASGGSDV